MYPDVLWKKKGEKEHLKDWTFMQKRLSSLERSQLICKIRINSVFITTQRVGANKENYISYIQNKEAEFSLYICVK